MICEAELSKFRMMPLSQGLNFAGLLQISQFSSGNNEGFLRQILAVLEVSTRAVCKGADG